MIQRWLQAVAKLFLLLATIGLLSCLVVHLCGLMGFSSPLSEWTTSMLVPGLFAVWLPTIFYASRVGLHFKRSDFWNAVLRNCPLWLRRSVYVFVAYGILNFIHIALVSGDSDPTGPVSSKSAWAITGHLMIFYSVAAAVLYSATRSVEQLNEHRCPGGHIVSVEAKHCEQCGARVDINSID